MKRKVFGVILLVLSNLMLIESVKMVKRSTMR